MDALLRRLGRQNPRVAPSISLYTRMEVSSTIPVQLLINRKCRTGTEKDYVKSVDKLAEAVETHRHDTEFFHNMILLGLGVLIAGNAGLAMKIYYMTGLENKLLTAELAKHKAKADSLTKEVVAIHADQDKTPSASMATGASPTATTDAGQSKKDGASTATGSSAGGVATTGSATGTAA